MKSHYYRASTASIGLALACALGLAACGGGKEQFPDQTIVAGLLNVTQPGLKLKLNGGTAHEVPPGNAFIFPDKISANSAYKVELGGQLPPNAISCEVLGGTGSVGIETPRTIGVECTLYTFKLGGSITGNFTGELVINNGSSTQTLQPGATRFELAPVPEGVPYSVTILSQGGNKCALTPARAAAPGVPFIDAPVGLMPKGELTNLNITCP